MRVKRREGRICPHCKENLATYYSSYCKPCASRYQVSVRKKYGKKSSFQQKAKLAAMLKEAKSVPCMDCGISYPHFVMDFDHVRGEKKFNLSVAPNRGLAFSRVREEMAKCDIVCSNCHRVRTFSRARSLKAEQLPLEQQV